MNGKTVWFFAALAALALLAGCASNGGQVERPVAAADEFARVEGGFVWVEGEPSRWATPPADTGTTRHQFAA